MGTFIVVCLALAVWAAAGGYCFSEAIVYVRLSRRNDRAGNLMEAVVRLSIGLGLFVVGLTMLIAVLPSSEVAALFFGLAFLGAGFWALQHLRANWQEFAGGEHRLQVLLRIFAIIAFPIIGIVILAAGL